jgi:hypothetical protein
VFLPLFGAALICGFLEVLGLMVKGTGTTRRNLSPEAANAIADLTVDFVRLLEIALAVVFAVMGVALPLAQPSGCPWIPQCIVQRSGMLSHFSANTTALSSKIRKGVASIHERRRVGR